MKEIKLSTILFIAIPLFLISVGFYLNSGATRVEEIEEDIFENLEPVHTFEGEIDNIDADPGVYRGVGVYDRNCIPTDPNNPHGEVNCDAGIRTKEYDVLNFNYKHVMSVNPCIAPDEPVEVEVLDEEGNAKVRRYVS